MKKMRCIIVDDEPIARKILLEFVERVPFLEFAGQFESAMQAETFLHNDHADIMLLDIEMPKRSGLDLLKSLSVKPLVILTTAFPEYALEGYELDIIDYLLKPVAFSRFLKAMQKAKEYAALRDAVIPHPSATWLFVRSEKRIEKIELADILYIESLGNYVNIYTENKHVIAYLTLKGLETQLPSSEFIKIHQSFLVSISNINSIEGNLVKIKNKELPIGRNYRDAVMQMVEQRLLRR
jgi:DNA-binding LytR/AlgR family response regulator